MLCKLSLKLRETKNIEFYRIAKLWVFIFKHLYSISYDH